MARTRAYVRTTIENPGTMIDHVADDDPHPIYTTDAEVSSAIGAHAAASDPHTGYQKESEKNQADGYCGLGSDGKVASAQLANYIVGVGTSKLTVGPDAPINPGVGDLWIDTSA